MYTFQLSFPPCLPKLRIPSHAIPKYHYHLNGYIALKMKLEKSADNLVQGST